MNKDEILKALKITIILVIINIIIGFIWILVDNLSLISSTATAIGFLELALFLISGACLLARDPINEDDRFDEVGQPTTGFKMVLYGRILLISAILLFLFMGLILVLGFLMNF